MKPNDEKTERWDAFLASHENPDDILDDEKCFMFQCGWKDRDWNVDKYHTALWQWREEKMKEQLS